MIVLGVSLIFFVSISAGLCSYNEHVSEQNVYPINIDLFARINIGLVNDWSRSELSITVPRPSARNARNLMNYLTHSNAISLDLKDLLLIVRSCEMWEGLKRKVDQVHQLSEFRRKWNNRPLVEFGPGSWKPEVSDYNPEDLGKELVRLAALKKRFDDKNKNLNPDE